MTKSYIVGIDEVGRGSLAGPVVVCAVLIPKNLSPKTYHLKPSLRDSKKLSLKRREKWFKLFKNHPQIKYEIARVYPKKIEEINISRAANLAALRAFKRLAKTYNLKPKTYQVYLDGGLYLGNQRYSKKNQRRSASSPRSSAIVAKTIIKGDEKIPAIKIASIIAKVSRDRLMTRLSKKCPVYSFEIHKGYGTRVHLAAIKKFGPCEIHRLTFIHKYLKID